MHRIIAALALMTVTACSFSAPQRPPAPAPVRVQPAPQQGPSLSAKQAARQFVKVVETVEPVAEAECKRRAPDLNCDYKIVIDDRFSSAPNAFQTLNKEGRPILAFNIPLIATARNADELAFVMGHEAAHHIERHIERQKRNATTGAMVLAGLTAIAGGGESAIKTATDLGASVGARTYSKDFELEADRLGTVIAHNAGYNPIKGAMFFSRLADPGNRFLGTHPPNAARVDIVRRTAATLN